MKIIIETSTGRVLGQTPDASYSRAGVILTDPPEGFDMTQADEWQWDGSRLAHDPMAALPRARASRIAQIRRDAAAAIEAMGWRIERAKEREQLGLPGETVNAVLLEREAIRRASSRCEAEIAAALEPAAVDAVLFVVTEADRATPERVTRLQFLSRFTEAEMAAIVHAADQSPALKAALLKWQTADGIVLTDAATIGGVNALEMLGLLTAGRAAEILAVEQQA